MNSHSCDSLTPYFSDISLNVMINTFIFNLSFLIIHKKNNIYFEVLYCNMINVIIHLNLQIN